MRVHTRYIYYVCILLAMIISLFTRINEKIFLIVEFISLLTLFILGKFTRTFYELREALNIEMNINLFKSITIIIFIIINLMVFLKYIIKKNISLRNWYADFFVLYI